MRRRPMISVIVRVLLVVAALAFALWLSVARGGEPWLRTIAVGLVAVAAGFVISRFLAKRRFAVGIALVVSFAIFLAIIAMPDVVGKQQAMWLFGVAAGLNVGGTGWPWSRRASVAGSASVSSR